MALIRVSVKRSTEVSGVRLEKGMSVDIPTLYPNPVVTNGGNEVQNAFLRVYGIDLKKANCLNMSFLDVTKIN
jgi:hypothetical protein